MKQNFIYLFILLILFTCTTTLNAVVDPFIKGNAKYIYGDPSKGESELFTAPTMENGKCTSDAVYMQIGYVTIASYPNGNPNNKTEVGYWDLEHKWKNQAIGKALSYNPYTYNSLKLSPFSFVDIGSNLPILESIGNYGFSNDAIVDVELLDQSNVFNDQELLNIPTNYRKYTDGRPAGASNEDYIKYRLKSSSFSLLKASSSNGTFCKQVLKKRNDGRWQIDICGKLNSLVTEKGGSNIGETFYTSSTNPTPTENGTLMYEQFAFMWTKYQLKITWDAAKVSKCNQNYEDHPGYFEIMEGMEEKHKKYDGGTNSIKTDFGSLEFYSEDRSYNYSNPIEDKDTGECLGYGVYIGSPRISIFTGKDGGTKILGNNSMYDVTTGILNEDIPISQTDNEAVSFLSSGNNLQTSKGKFKVENIDVISHTNYINWQTDNLPKRFNDKFEYLDIPKFKNNSLYPGAYVNPTSIGKRVLFRKSDFALIYDKHLRTGIFKNINGNTDLENGYNEGDLWFQNNKGSFSNNVNFTDNEKFNLTLWGMLFAPYKVLFEIKYDPSACDTTLCDELYLKYKNNPDIVNDKVFQAEKDKFKCCSTSPVFAANPVLCPNGSGIDIPDPNPDPGIDVDGSCEEKHNNYNSIFDTLDENTQIALKDECCNIEGKNYFAEYCKIPTDPDPEKECKFFGYSEENGFISNEDETELRKNQENLYEIISAYNPDVEYKYDHEKANPDDSKPYYAYEIANNTNGINYACEAKYEYYKYEFVIPNLNRTVRAGSSLAYSYVPLKLDLEYKHIFTTYAYNREQFIKNINESIMYLNERISEVSDACDKNEQITKSMCNPIWKSHNTGVELKSSDNNAYWSTPGEQLDEEEYSCDKKVCDADGCEIKSTICIRKVCNDGYEDVTYGTADAKCAELKMLNDELKETEYALDRLEKNKEECDNYILDYDFTIEGTLSIFSSINGSTIYQDIRYKPSVENDILVSIENVENSVITVKKLGILYKNSLKTYIDRQTGYLALTDNLESNTNFYNINQLYFTNVKAIPGTYSTHFKLDTTSDTNIKQIIDGQIVKMAEELIIENNCDYNIVNEYLEIPDPCDNPNPPAYCKNIPTGCDGPNPPVYCNTCWPWCEGGCTVDVTTEEDCDGGGDGGGNGGGNGGDKIPEKLKPDSLGFYGKQVELSTEKIKAFGRKPNNNWNMVNWNNVSSHFDKNIYSNEPIYSITLNKDLITGIKKYNSETNNNYVDWNNFEFVQNSYEGRSSFLTKISSNQGGNISNKLQEKNIKWIFNKPSKEDE
ncbi:MAG: hypothetical protein ACK5NF_06880 [Bacilli bacterium]